MVHALGVEPDGPAMLSGDNNNAVLNCLMPHSVLKKKLNAVSCHCVYEAIAAKIINFAHVPSTANCADVLTKPLPVGLFRPLVKKSLFCVPNETEFEL